METTPGATTSPQGAVAAPSALGESMNRASWIVLVSAFLGWMFDAMDLHIFTVVMIPAVRELTGFTDARVPQIGGMIIAGKLLCWGLGGILFGVIADRIGRARVMMITIIIYSVFTGLSGLAQNWYQLMAAQMLAGIGIGGEWAAGAALVVETWPKRHRAKAVQVMQLAFVFGLILASVLVIALSGAGWRWVLIAGSAPAFLGLAIRWITPESNEWRAIKNASVGGSGPKLGSLKAIFQGDLARRTIVGSLIAMAMMVGSWGGTTLFPAFVQKLLPGAGLTEITRATGVAFMSLNVGALCGYCAILLAVSIWPRISRRLIYVVVCVGAWASSTLLFAQVETFAQLQKALAVLGFFAVGGFGVVALYLTELFPLNVRATGQGFTWNVARMVTALGPLLGTAALVSYGLPVVGMSVSLVFLVGLAAIFFGPETAREANV